MSIAEGKVSVWINKVPPAAYPANYFQENYDRDEDEPICQWAGNFQFNSYDHDFMDVARVEGNPVPVRELLKGCSYINSVINKIERAANTIGMENAFHAILLYDFDYAAREESVAEDQYMRFLGTFIYDKSQD